MAASQVQRVKRAFVFVLLQLARVYKVATVVNRESPDNLLIDTYKKVARKAHPDKGGSNEDTAKLNAARQAWDEARRPPQQKSSQRGGSEDDSKSSVIVAPATSSANAHGGFRIHATAVLLTFQGFNGLAMWWRFLTFVKANLKLWNALRWCATMEENKLRHRTSGKQPPKLHAHLMLQFRTVVDVTSKSFAFEKIAPNAGPNRRPGQDYCGEGYCRKKLQQSIDRAMFYVGANKIGTCVGPRDELCVAGNYFPNWTGKAEVYQVLGKWPETLWKQRKLTHDVYNEYLLLCRDNVLGRKRNLDAVRQGEEERALRQEMAATSKRIKADPTIYQPFPKWPKAEEWLASFLHPALRYALMIVWGPSFAGKTEWAKALFHKPLELKIGHLVHFPDGMRSFQRHVHDGIVLDDVRDLKFLVDHQDKLQGKYDSMVEFASTQGGTCAFCKYLYATPVVATINDSTANLSFLTSHDWLAKPQNRLLVQFTSPTQIAFLS